ncbi:hypothetical protein N7461_000925 [Penicillium sp. DV-2018c]|nr:hypothetical protein N7461_000925 [Penicillium sp. DV-2018c]
MGKEVGKPRSDVFSLSCQVDGFLESSSTFRAQEILEAKALGRKNHERKVSWQETMEMVAALLTGHPKKKLLKDMVTLFAQTGAEMYLLNASHKDGQDEFVEIRRYGPYFIAEEEDVRYFAKLALAMALRASEEDGERILFSQGIN